MAKFFMGVRMPNRSYERLPLDNIDTEQNVSYLRGEISRQLNIPKDELELIYCGNILEDNQTIKDTNIVAGSTIHVFKKTAKTDSYVPKKYTDSECRKIAELYGTVCNTSLTVISRYNIIQNVLSEYPEFRKNLGAQAIIKDPILFQSLKNPEVVQKIAENYSIICDAAKFIVQSIEKETSKNTWVTQSEETSSDLTSSSEEESSSNISQTEQARIRRISRDQLAAALLLAGSASLNSLPNIAQRNSNLIEEQQRQQELQNATTSSTPSTASTTPVRITPSNFNSALSQALLSSGVSRVDEQTLNMDTSESGLQSPSVNTVSDTNSDTRYSTELQQMREMGLSDNNVNLQALILSNGNVEAAINLVFSGMNLF